MNLQHRSFNAAAPRRRLFARAFAPTAAALLLLSSGNAQACAACGCTLSSDWDSQSFSANAGVQLDLQENFIDQSQLRHGLHAVAASNYPLPDLNEVEQRTTNRYTTLGIDTTLNSNWALNVQLPFVDRTHSTIAAGDTAISTSQGSGFGDARVLARYQGLNENMDSGLQFGLKLPTGSFSQTFNGGPQNGQPLDRGLQLGSGTTDLLFGGYHFGALGDLWPYFAQALFNTALDSRAGYKPGTGVTLTSGVQYTGWARVTPQFQVNVRVAKRDMGENADTLSTGGTLAYLSPGATVKITDQFKVYAFVQLPAYQRLNGLQLAPRWTASAGVRYGF